MPFIIVEGCTAVGKSTLYDKLKERLQDSNDNELTTIHHGRPSELTRKWALREYVTRWEGPAATRNLLADRWSWGETTYATIYRPDTNVDNFGLLGRSGWRWTELFLASRGACVALLTADNETLAERLADRGDDHVTNTDDLFQISNLYNHARRESVNVSSVFDTSGEIDEIAYNAFVDALLEEAETRSELSQRIISAFPKYVGSLTPDVLLVGDERNPLGDFETSLPFAPVGNNSGDYLLNALPDQFWRGVGLVNGCEDTDLSALHAALGEPVVVALGANAAAAVAETGLEDVREVPHPAYVKRFHNDRQKEYGQAIVELVANGSEGVLSWRP